MISLLRSLDMDRGDKLTSRGVIPTSPLDEFASPVERVPIYDGPAPPRPPRRSAHPAGQQDVWQAIANRYPRKFKKALAYVKWLDRMERRYSSRIL